MKDKITTFLLKTISAFLVLFYIVFLYNLLPWYLFGLLIIIAIFINTIKDADKYYASLSPEQRQRLDDLDEELSKSYIIPKAPIPTEPKPELLQVAEMYRDHMQNTPSEGSLAYNITIKAIDNYYKKAN